MTVVGFLCTHVKNPTVEDMAKLMRLLEYLNRTKAYKLKVEPKRDVQSGDFCRCKFWDA